MKLGISGRWAMTHSGLGVKRMLLSMSMEPWAAIKKALLMCGGHISPCLGPYPTAAYPEFHVGCRLVGEFFTLPIQFECLSVETSLLNASRCYVTVLFLTLQIM